MTIRLLFLQSLHKNQQRLSSLALIVSEAPKSRPTTARDLASRYGNAIFRKVPVIPSDIDRLSNYIADRSLVSRYSKSKHATIASVRDVLPDTGVEIQHWFLSDPELASATGAETGQSVAKSVAVCQELDLLNSKTNTILAYGELLNSIAQVRNVTDAFHSGITNPFTPDPPFVTAAFLRILQYDLPFQRAVLEAVGEGDSSFKDIWLNAVQIIHSVEQATPSSNANRAATEWLSRQRTSAVKLEERARESGYRDTIGPLMGTLTRPFEDILLPRLEFLVDAGALEKPDPGSYRYRRSFGYQPLLNLLDRGPDGLASHYFATIAEIQGRKIRHLEDHEILDHLRQGYLRFKNISGYATILETTTFANCVAMDRDPWPIVELSDSLAFLQRLAQSDPPKTRIGPDRHRRPFTVRILE